MTEQTTLDRDRAAAAAVEEHHAAMSRTLAGLAASLISDARAGGPTAGATRSDLVRWCREELLPHAAAEESTLYDAAATEPEGRLLVEAMLAEHRSVLALVEELERAADPVEAAALGRALQAVFEVHLAKENDQVLPLLLADRTVSVADLLGGMHELLGGGSDDR